MYVSETALFECRKHQDSYGLIETCYKIYSGFETLEPNDIYKLFIPPMTKSLKINIFITIQGKQITLENNPEITNFLFEKLSFCKTWELLGYSFDIIMNPGSNETFQLDLNDEIIDRNTIEDLLNSNNELNKLNHVDIIEVKNIDILIDLKYENLTHDGIWQMSTILKDLNYAMIENYSSLSSFIPLVMGYLSRKTYKLSVDFIESIANTFVKSLETSIIERRSIIIGFLKQISNFKSFEEWISQLHHASVKRNINNNEGLSLEFFSLD